MAFGRAALQMEAPVAASNAQSSSAPTEMVQAIAEGAGEEGKAKATTGNFLWIPLLGREQDLVELAGS
jgi:hypothetical protein